MAAAVASRYERRSVAQMTVSEARCNLMVADMNWILEDNEASGLVARRSCQRTTEGPVLAPVICAHDNHQITNSSPTRLFVGEFYFL